MRKKPISFGAAIFLLVAGILLGSVFTFGMQYSNKMVERKNCDAIQTQFLDYDEIRQPKRPRKIKEIAIDCTNGNRYFIDGVCITTELRNALSKLSPHQNITLLIHPNSNTIVDFSTESNSLLSFDDTITRLHKEATVFSLLGIFMYFCGIVGLYYTVSHCIRKRRRKKR